MLNKRNTILAALLLIIVAIGIYVIYRRDFPAIPAGAWQAVFLENNQVYFGKLASEGHGYVTLTGVYYLRDNGNPDNDQAIDLVKLGGEFHRPEDAMYIPEDKILFWENLSPSSPVVKSIQSAQK